MEYYNENFGFIDSATLSYILGEILPICSHAAMQLAHAEVMMVSQKCAIQANVEKYSQQDIFFSS